MNNIEEITKVSNIEYFNSGHKYCDRHFGQVLNVDPEGLDKISYDICCEFNRIFRGYE